MKNSNKIKSFIVCMYPCGQTHNYTDYYTTSLMCMLMVNKNVICNEVKLYQMKGVKQEKYTKVYDIFVHYINIVQLHVCTIYSTLYCTMFT